MIDPHSYETFKTTLLQRVQQDRFLLEQLRQEVRVLSTEAHRIQPRSSTAISLVATDGGNTQVQFDPFLIQIVRVVDSSNNEHYLDVLTPSTDIDALNNTHLQKNGEPTALGEMITALGLSHLSQLSYILPDPTKDSRANVRWIEVYRELMEWAVLLSLVRDHTFGSDTLIVFDGLLRSKIFRGDLFRKYLNLLIQAINQHYHRKRRIYLVGVAKHSKVLSRYRLAMALEKVLLTHYPAYVEIPRELEEKAYVHADYARGDDIALPTERLNRFVGGKMFFVKFGSRPQDPIWPVDIFLPQHKHAAVILGHLLADATNGFPIPFYPLCLQRAHENAALVHFDYHLLQDNILNSIRHILGEEAIDLDIFRLQDMDPAQERYAFE
ncbi:MAG: DNA double-strand break repair nuclease NurA [Chloroflexota bacterium]